MVDSSFVWRSQITVAIIATLTCWSRALLASASRVQQPDVTIKVLQRSSDVIGSCDSDSIPIMEAPIAPLRPTSEKKDSATFIGWANKNFVTSIGKIGTAEKGLSR